jgi:hypothetical protein
MVEESVASPTPDGIADGLLLRPTIAVIPA